MKECSPSGRAKYTKLRHPSLELTFGEKVIILYFTAFYFMPMIANIFIDVPIKYYLQGDLRFIGAFLFASGYLFTFLFVRRTLDLNLKIRVPLRSIIRSRWATTLIFLLFLTFALRFSMQFSSSFRHDQTYSSAGLIPILTFALKMMCTVYIFASISSKALVGLKWYHFTIYITSIFLAFVGSYDLVFLAMALYSWFRAARVRIIRLVRLIFSKVGGIIVIILLAGVVFAGMANKIGFERAVDFFSDGGLAVGFELFANRTFYHFYSLALQLNDYIGTFHLGINALEIVSYQGVRRFLILLGLDLPNETLQTVSRLNYLVISGNRVESDAGASPGLLGSIFYLPGGLFMLPVHMACIYNAVSMFDNIMGRAKYSLFAYLGGIVLLQALTDSFMDNFNPFSIGFIALLMLFIMSSYARNVSCPEDNRR